jgi:D-hydroxyproline dehydrogenase subunit beta
MNSRTYDVAIVGAGIVGAACALELSAEKLRVAVIDERGVGMGATAAGMGHVVVLDDSDAQLALTRYSLELWNRLFPQFSPECEFWRCGTVWVAENENELRLAKKRCENFERHGVRAQFLTSSELAELEPNLRSGLVGGFLAPGDASLVPLAAARFLIARARENGAEVIAKRVCQMTDAQLVLSDGGEISAAFYINATGTAAGTLSPGLPIRARKGHILVMKPDSNFARHQIMEQAYMKSAHAGEEHASVAFAVRQKANGELLVGSSRQYGVEDPEVQPQVLELMRNRALVFMPGLAKAACVTSWAGFRAGTPDGLPLIGLCPGFERVYAATGHEGLGVTAAPATARLLANAILRRDSETFAGAFSPGRFTVGKR